MDLGQHLAVAPKFQHAGTEYTVGPLGLYEISMISDFIVRQPLEDAKAAAIGLPADIAKEFISLGWKEYKELKKKFQAEPQEIFERMQELPIIAELLWLAISKNHPDLTKPFILSLVTMANMEEITELLNAASGISGTNPTEATPQSAVK